MKKVIFVLIIIGIFVIGSSCSTQEISQSESTSLIIEKDILPFKWKNDSKEIDSELFAMFGNQEIPFCDYSYLIGDEKVITCCSTSYSKPELSANVQVHPISFSVDKNDIVHYLDAFMFQLLQLDHIFLKGCESNNYAQRIDNNIVFVQKTEQIKDPEMDGSFGFQHDIGEKGDISYFIVWCSNKVCVIIAHDGGFSHSKEMPIEIIKTYLKKYPSVLKESDLSKDINEWIRKDIELRISQLVHQNPKVREFAYQRLENLVSEYANDIFTDSFHGQVMDKEPQKAVQILSEWWSKIKDKVYWNKQEKKVIIKGTESQLKQDKPPESPPK